MNTPDDDALVCWCCAEPLDEAGKCPSRRACCVPDEGDEHCDHHPEWHDERGCNHPGCGR
jgi:hypothetical protein